MKFSFNLFHIAFNEGVENYSGIVIGGLRMEESTGSLFALGIDDTGIYMDLFFMNWDKMEE